MRVSFISIVSCLAFVGCGGDPFDSVSAPFEQQDGATKPDTANDNIVPDSIVENKTDDADANIKSDVDANVDEGIDAIEEIQCSTEKDCPPSTECGTSVCNAGYVCGVVPAIIGTPCANGQGTCNGALKCFVCTPGTKVCDNSFPKECNADGQWNVGNECVGATPICSSGQCLVVAPNCAGMASLCNGKSCCEANEISGGSFIRSYDGISFNVSTNKHATISSFKLDTYETTVSRFRVFVSAYPYSKPVAGAGKNAKVLGDLGWNILWDVYLPSTQDQLKTNIKCSGFSTWTDVQDNNENKPINCVSWYEAFAFCAWDGGRLATEAEWNYAAAGGNEQRVYPWSNPPATSVLDVNHAAFGCMGDGSASGNCASTDIMNVGHYSTLGDSKWSQADMAGNMWEWVLDFDGIYPYPCADCANLIEVSSGRIIRGGAYWQDQAPPLRTSYRIAQSPIFRKDDVGIRCVRNN